MYNILRILSAKIFVAVDWEGYIFSFPSTGGKCVEVSGLYTWGGQRQDVTLGKATFNLLYLQHHKSISHITTPQGRSKLFEIYVS